VWKVIKSRDRDLELRWCSGIFNIEKEPHSKVVSTKIVSYSGVPSMELTITLRRHETNVGVGNVVGWYTEKPCGSINVVHNQPNDSKGFDRGGSSHCLDRPEVTFRWRFFEIVETVGYRL
jgi:hypothetical protein